MHHKGTHTITTDHSRCNHDDPENFVCQPTAEYACIAPLGAYCRFGCVEDPCSENGWHKSDDNPGQCHHGHPLVAHECWALPWLDSVDVSDTHAGAETLPYGYVYVDGPIDIVEWDEDYLIWEYSST